MCAGPDTSSLVNTLLDNRHTSEYEFIIICLRLFLLFIGRCSTLYTRNNTVYNL